MSAPTPSPIVSSPAPITPSPMAPSPAPVAIWMPRAASTIGPFTIKASNGKYMFFDIVDQQGLASNFNVTMSDTPQLFLFGTSIQNLSKFPTNVGLSIQGSLFPGYKQSDGSLWAYASSGYNATTGANTSGDKHMINTPVQQTYTNWNTPYSQSFNWSFWANSDGTYKIQNSSAGYASPSSDGTKIVLGGPVENWTITYVSYPPPPPPPQPAADTPAPSPSSEFPWLWVGVGLGVLFFILIIVLLISASRRKHGKSGKGK